MNCIKQNSARTIRVNVGPDIEMFADIKFNFYQQGRFVLSRALRDCQVEDGVVTMVLTSEEARKFSPNRATIEPEVTTVSGEHYTAKAWNFMVLASETEQEG